MTQNEQFISDVRTVQTELQTALLNWAKSAQVIIGAAATNEFMKDARTLTVGAGDGTAVTGPGTLRIITGRLARSLVDSFSGGMQEGISQVTVEDMALRLVYGSKVPYAYRHEYGGNEAVQSHVRKLTRAVDRPIGMRYTWVKSHNRTVPARPFLNPAFDAVKADLQRLLETTLPAAFAKVATLRRGE